VTWAVTSIQTVHLLAITVVLGSVLLLNLQLLGVLRGWSASQLARTLSPFITGGMIVVLLTGVPLFLGGPMRYFQNPVFGSKIQCAAIVSLLLWFGTGAAGRTIGWS
jgi:hypothetical protein